MISDEQIIEEFISENNDSTESKVTERSDVQELLNEANEIIVTSNIVELFSESENLRSIVNSGSNNTNAMLMNQGPQITEVINQRRYKVIASKYFKPKSKKYISKYLVSISKSIQPVIECIRFLDYMIPAKEEFFHKQQDKDYCFQLDNFLFAMFKTSTKVEYNIMKKTYTLYIEESNPNQQNLSRSSNENIYNQYLTWITNIKGKEAEKFAN